ncbi:MAG TPA: sulfotransferase family protein [Phycisphaerales bacterium]|nr:sulfotransferase family protein [Phycisphaerales bacterium]
MNPKTQATSIYNKGLEAYNSGDFMTGAQAFSQFVKLQPKNAEALLGLGMCLSKIGRFEHAIKHLQKAAKLKPMMPEVRVALGQIDAVLQNESGAVAHFERALAIRPYFGPAVLGLTDLYRKKGEFDKAADLIDKALAHTKELDFQLVGAFASLADRTGRHEDAIRMLEEALKQDLSKTHRMILLFKLADVLDKSKEYEQAWEVAEQANALKFVLWDADKYDRCVDKLISVWTRERMQAMPKAGSDSEQPVFVVGMPRSGTSLIEQIIASHPQGAGAGELAELLVIASKFEGMREPKGIVFLQDVNRLRAPAIKQAAEHYLQSLRHTCEITGGDPNADRIVDKLPYNYILLPLVQILFPNAKIIHVHRDPRDVCVSNFFQDFLGPLGYSYNINHMARCYADYERIIAHMHEVIDLPILDVRYESLVSDPEPEIRKILDHIGLPFDEACLEFHKAKREVHTASLEQVRKPMYTSSKARWRRYGSKLDPLISELRAAGVHLPDDDSE